jgi:Tol biopolymer transport system component
MKCIALTCLAVLLTVAGTSPASAQSGTDLFQQALRKEQVDGDLKAAIALYQRILKEHATDRALSAKTLVQLGQAYEKMGNADARSSYQRVIRDYADQSEQVAVARARLGALSAGATLAARAGDAGVVFRQIGFDGLGNPTARFSPDGKTVVYVHMKESVPRFSIRARNLVSGAERVLVDSIQDVSHFFQLSMDGSTVAYRNGRRVLRTVNVREGDPRTVWTSPDSATGITPGGWAPDNRHLAVFVNENKSRTTRLVIVPTVGGTPKPVVSGSESELHEFAQFSPSGTYIAGMKTLNGNTDVYVWSADGGDEQRITTHPAVDEAPYWSPDGSFLVFGSDRSGNYDLWAVPMTGSTPAGSPFRVKAGIGRRALVTGMMPSGAVTIAMPTEGSPDDLFVLAGDLTESATGNELRPFAGHATQRSFLRWSADAKRIAYTSRKGSNQGRIYVSSGSAPEETEIPTRGYFLTNVEWAPDGEHLIFPGVREEDGRAGVFSVSLADHRVEPVYLGGQTGRGRAGAFVNLHWLPVAGRFFVQALDSSRLESYLLDANGQAFQRVGDELPTTYWAWPSPNGRFVAYRDDQSLRAVSVDGRRSHLLAEWTDTLWMDVQPGWSPAGDEVAWAYKTELSVFNAARGLRRVLATVPEGSRILNPPVWAPDGSQVAYVVRSMTAAVGGRDEVWLIPAVGGTPTRRALAPQGYPLLQLEAWPSTGALSATGRSRPSAVGSGYQHWILENFLPKTEPQTKAKRR